MSRVPIEEALGGGEHRGCVAIKRAAQRQGAQIPRDNVGPSGKHDASLIQKSAWAGDFIDAGRGVVEQGGENGARSPHAQKRDLPARAQPRRLGFREPGVQRAASLARDGHVARDDQGSRVRPRPQRFDEGGIVPFFRETVERKARIANLGGYFARGGAVGWHRLSSHALIEPIIDGGPYAASRRRETTSHGLRNAFAWSK